MLWSEPTGFLALAADAGLEEAVDGSKGDAPLTVLSMPIPHLDRTGLNGIEWDCIEA